MTKNDISLIKTFRNAILNLKYGKKIQYQMDDTQVLSPDHVITIHRADDNSFIVKTTYRVSADTILNMA